MEYIFAGSSLMPPPFVITDNKPFTPSNIFAVTCAALSARRESVTIARLEPEDVKYRGGKYFSFVENQDIPPLAPSKHLNGSKCGIAGVSWYYFGLNILSRYGYKDDEAKLIWTVIDNESIALFDEIEHKAQKDQPTFLAHFYGTTDDEFETACQLAEQWLRVEIAVTANDVL